MCCSHERIESEFENYGQEAHNLKNRTRNLANRFPGDIADSCLLWQWKGDSTIIYALDLIQVLLSRKVFPPESYNHVAKLHPVPRDAMWRNPHCLRSTNRDASCQNSAFKKNDKWSSSVTFLWLVCLRYGMFHVTPNIWINIFFKVLKIQMFGVKKSNSSDDWQVPSFYLLIEGSAPSK